ncbi:MAG TPA: response regulator transcription factor [Candidatus Obscuribacterales bacterium]
MAKLLVVEDDVALCGKLTEWLTWEKHIVESANDGEMGWELLREYDYDAIILDWNLPKLSGVELCTKFRMNGGTTPVLMLTGRDKVIEKIEGLDAGADDYVVKPFQLQELSARLRALLRRPQGMLPSRIEAGPLSLDTKAHIVYKNGKELQLLPKEFAILEFLMRHPNQLFNAKALLERVWGSDSNATEETVRTYIKTLRRKITDKGETCPIKTVHWMGYKLEVA